MSIGYVTQAVDITFPCKKREKNDKKEVFEFRILKDFKRKNLFLGKVPGKKPK